MIESIAAAYVALMACGWMLLPWHVQIGDLLFPVLLVLALPAARMRGSRLDFFLLLFMAGSALSIPGSISPARSSLDLLKEAYLFGAYLVLAHVMARIGVRSVVRWFPAAVAVMCGLSLFAALAYKATGTAWFLFGAPMPLPYIGTAFRLTGTLETPEFFGNLLTFAMPLGVACWKQASDRRPWTVALILMAIAEVLTFSKSLAGFVVAMTVFLWPEWRGRRGELGLKVASAAVATLLVLAFNATATVTVRDVDLRFGNDPTVPPPSYLYARQEGAGADTVELRIAYNPMSYYLLKKAEWVAWKEHPTLGIGVGTFYLEAERAYQEGRLTQAYRRSAAHSTIFGRLAETGLIGLATLAIAFFGIWRSTVAAARHPGSDGHVAWACLAAFTGLVVNGINVDIMHFRFLWLGLAAVRAIEQQAV